MSKTATSGLGWSDHAGLPDGSPGAVDFRAQDAVVHRGHVVYRPAQAQASSAPLTCTRKLGCTSRLSRASTSFGACRALRSHCERLGDAEGLFGGLVAGGSLQVGGQPVEDLLEGLLHLGIVDGPGRFDVACAMPGAGPTNQVSSRPSCPASILF